jgi:hypothetical protein
MTQHTRADLGQDNIDPVMPLTAGPTLLDGAAASSAPGAAHAVKVQCDACPVLCHISPGRTGACDRWGNINGALTRLDPVLIAQQPGTEGANKATCATRVKSSVT